MKKRKLILVDSFGYIVFMQTLKQVYRKQMQLWATYYVKALKMLLFPFQNTIIINANTILLKNRQFWKKKRKSNPDKSWQFVWLKKENIRHLTNHRSIWLKDLITCYFCITKKMMDKMFKCVHKNTVRNARNLFFFFLNIIYIISSLEKWP